MKERTKRIFREKGSICKRAKKKKALERNTNLEKKKKLLQQREKEKGSS